MASRRLQVDLPVAPHGWRTPQFKAMVLGYRVVPGRQATCPCCLRPTQQGHARRVPNIRVETFSTKDMRAFQERVVPVMFEAAVRAAADAGEPIGSAAFLRGAVALRVRAILPRPAGEHRVTLERPRERAAKKPDLTNVVKLTEDCCTRARWWKDDAQVAEIRADAWLQAVPAHRCSARCPDHDPPRVQVIAWELETGA